MRTEAHAEQDYPYVLTNTEEPTEN